MKTLYLRYTVPVEVEVADDFPVSADAIRKIAKWKSNDWSDGRYPFDVEMMHSGASSMASYHISEAVSYHYAERVEAHFGRANDHWSARNALAERCEKSVHRRSPREIEVSVTAHPIDPEHKYASMPHVVLCRDDAKEDGSAGDYRLATRTVFEGRESASLYASTIAASRDPIVSPLPLAELRVGEDRGRLEYWAPPKLPTGE